MTPEILKKRTKQFGHNCVKIALSLPKDDLGIHIKRQLLRCSTSVGANYRSACVAQSTMAFVAKLSIAFEEADECIFWLEFATDDGIFKKDITTPLIKEASELCNIFGASRKTARNKIQKTNNN